MNMSKLSRLLYLALAVELMGCAATTGGAPTTGAAGAEVSRATSDLPSASGARSGAKVHVELGLAYLDAGRMGVALDEAKTALAFDKTYPQAHMLAATVYSSLEQYELAAPSFEEAARLAPGDPEVNAAYGWFLCARGREDEGVRRLEQAARNPYYRTPARAWSNAGLCYVRKHDDAAAEERFLRAVQADGSDLRAIYHLAEINLRGERLLRAKQWVEALQQQAQVPDAEILWLALRIERKLGNQDTVRAIAEKLRRSYPGSNEYQLFLQGKFE